MNEFTNENNIFKIHDTNGKLKKSSVSIYINDIEPLIGSYNMFELNVTMSSLVYFEDFGFFGNTIHTDLYISFYTQNKVNEINKNMERAYSFIGKNTDSFYNYFNAAMSEEDYHYMDNHSLDEAKEFYKSKLIEYLVHTLRKNTFNNHYHKLKLPVNYDTYVSFKDSERAKEILANRFVHMKSVNKNDTKNENSIGELVTNAMLSVDIDDIVTVRDFPYKFKIYGTATSNVYTGNSVFTKSIPIGLTIIFISQTCMKRFNENEKMMSDLLVKRPYNLTNYIFAVMSDDEFTYIDGHSLYESKEFYKPKFMEWLRSAFVNHKFDEYFPNLNLPNTYETLITIKNSEIMNEIMVDRFLCMKTK